MATSRRRLRRPADLAVVATGVTVLAVSALAVQVAPVSAPELETFRAVNDGVEVPFALAWLPMQLGNVVAVPVATLAAVARRRLRLAATLALGGMVAWVSAKAVKMVVERGRPGALLEEAVLRDAPSAGLGFVSGHAAVAVALATAVWPYLGPRGRALAMMLAGVVCVLRVYVGAHLPLDVVGGAALGLAVGSTAHLVLGRPAGG